MYRDFSESSKNKLLNLVSQVENEKICDFTDWVGDRWYDFESWIGNLNIKNYINNVNEYHKKVIDKNNTTASTIETIFQAVQQADAEYNVIFKDIWVQLAFTKKYTDELGEIVNPSNGKFNSDYISQAVSEILTEYSNYLKSEIRPNNDIYGDIIEFDVTALFLDSRNTLVDAVATAWTSDWLQNLTSFIGIGDNLNEIAVRQSIESVIASVLNDKHTAEDFFEEYTSALKPEEAETAKKIIDLFLKGGEIYTETEIANILKIDVKDITNSDYLKWLCQTDNLEFLNQLSGTIKSTLGAYGDAVETLDISAQLLTKVFNDYTEDIKYLEAIKKALVDGGYDNEMVNDVVNTLLWEYRNQYISAAADGVEKLAQIGINEGVDKVLPLLDIFIGSKDISSTVIGLSEATDNLGLAYATQHYSYALVDKYNFYRQKIQSGNYTQSDVQQCNLYFTLAKAAKLQEYRAIKAVLEDALNSFSASVFRSSEDKQYTREIIADIDAEIERLENLTI